MVLRIKAHIGVDADSELVHTLVTTLAKVARLMHCCTVRKRSVLARPLTRVWKSARRLKYTDSFYRTFLGSIL